MTGLLLHGREVKTVFDLLGDKENDITYSLGWALSQSDRLARALLADIFPDEEPGQLTATRLQQFVLDGGFTDIELESERLHLIVEAKRGWNLPDEAQLARYAPSLHGRDQNALAVFSEASREYALPRLPKEVAGVPVLYRSWKDVTGLVERVAGTGGHAEKRLLRELVRYLKGLMTMQNVRDNMVYVVSLSSQQRSWSGELTPVRIVSERSRYFHPVGGGPGGWPKDPPNYLGFRYHGQLQRIHHVEGYEVVTNLHEVFEELPDEKQAPHYLYSLGPLIEPAHRVATGNLYASLRVWAALDLLLTSETIADARDATNERLRAAGEV